MSENPMSARPMVIYDGECSFCRIWVDHWKRLTGNRVEYRPSQEVGVQYPQIPPEQFARAVQLILPDGTFYGGAKAVFQLLKDVPGRGWLLWSYQNLPGFASVSEKFYAFVAAHRDLFYWVTRLLWGRDIGPHPYTLSRWLFLRALGLIYLVAFVSLGVQIKGLIGTNGILPVTDFLNEVANIYPAQHVLLVPTLAWFNSSNAFLQALCIAGMIASILVILDILTLPALVSSWLLYLSLVNIGQDFLSFQWDILLLEVGFLAIFLTSFHVLPCLSRQRAPSRVVIWLFRWLLFRLTFMSGVVKLASGDPTWHNLTALQYHFWTQPLPTPIAWYMAQLPPAFLQFSTAFTFFCELFIPFLFFMPRGLRFVGGCFMIVFQFIIILTGNYTFFNWLTMALCILLFDNSALRRFFPTRMREVKQPRASRVKRILAVILVIILVPVSAVRVLNLFDAGVSLPLSLQSAYDQVSGWYLTSGYGLFAVMTTTRPEIIIEGSNDGQNWQPYEFPYKVGDLNRPPPVIAPFQPRLDWQMWFAALGGYQGNSWFVNFVYRLLQGSPDVLALLSHNPFPDAPPTYIRAELYNYRFSDGTERSATGAWWTRVATQTYLPPVSLKDFGKQ